MESSNARINIQCIKRFRVSRSEVPHEHVYHIHLIRSIGDIKSAHDSIHHALATIIAACNVSINALTNKAIREFIETCIIAGQKLPNERTSDIIPCKIRKNIANEIIKTSKLIKKEALLPFTNICYNDS